MTDKNKPSLIAYHVRQAGENSYWDRVGAAFAHKDESGFDLVLDSLPVGGRVVLRIPSDNPDSNEAS